VGSYAIIAGTAVTAF